MKPPLLRRHPLTLLLACLATLTMLFISEVSAWRAERNLLQIVSITQARLDIQQLDASLRVASTAAAWPGGADGAADAATSTWARHEIHTALAALQAHYRHDAYGAHLLQPLRLQVQRRLDELAHGATTPASAAPSATSTAATLSTTATMAMAAGAAAAARADASAQVRGEPQEAVDAASAALLAHEWDKLRVAQSAVNEVLLAGRLGIAALSVGCLLALVLYLRQAGQRRRHQQSLQTLAQADHQRLEAEVARRTAELTELNRHLLSAREDERALPARDLHDELGALLTAAKLDAARIRSRLGANAPEAQERLAQLVLTLNRGIALKRRIIEDLRPSALTNLGLVATLEILAQEFAERSGLALDLDLAAVPLDADAELVVFRIVQEATTNIAKHAQARRFGLLLRSEPGAGPGGVRLQVRDDGAGFSTAAPMGSAHGLAGMRFRVEAEGGRVAVQSKPGAGTVIDVWLPASAAPAVQAAATPLGAPQACPAPGLTA